MERITSSTKNLRCLDNVQNIKVPPPMPLLSSRESTVEILLRKAREDLAVEKESYTCSVTWN